MSTVQIHQFDAHLTARPQLVWVQVGQERRAKATFVAISNDVRGTGAERRERPTAILWTSWGKQAEAHVAHLGKGAHVNVLGRMELSHYRRGETGEEIYRFEFTAEAVHYLDSKTTAQARQTRQSQPAA